MTLDAYLTIDALNTITGIFPTQALADTFDTNNVGSTALSSQITGMPDRVNVGWCYHLANNEVYEEHPFTDLEKLQLGIISTREFLSEVQDSINAHGVNFASDVVNRTHDAFAGVRKGVYLVARNTDLTILERLVFLDLTQEGPSNITATDVHGKVLEFLHWADEPDNSDLVFPGTAIAFADPSTGARIAFTNLVDDSENDVFTATAYPDPDFTNVDLNSDWPSDITS